MKKAIFFDIDGTLLDTTEFIFQAFEHTFKTHNLFTPARATIVQTVGKSLDECYQILTQTPDTTPLTETHRTFQESNLHLSIPFTHTIQTLATLKKANLSLAAISTRESRTLHTSLDHAGIRHFFDCIISGDEVIHVKPHPEPVLKALAYFSLSPEQAFMVGDTSVDIDAGKNAGVETVGVTYGIHGEKIKESAPDYCINDIVDLLTIPLLSSYTFAT